MNSYEIIAQAVKKYVSMLIDNNRIVDNDYIVHFYQKYKWQTKWEECTEIVSSQAILDEELEFWSDFCEGQTEVADITILALYEIGEKMRGNAHNILITGGN